MKVTEIFNDMSYGPAPEANDSVKDWLANKGQGFGLFIDGQWQQSDNAKTFETKNPATGDVLGTITQATETDIDKAVAAAKSAQPEWQALGSHGRARYLYAIARVLQKRARQFAVLESMDNGKPIRESRDIDVPLLIRHFYHHAGWAQLLDSEFPEFEAVGVVGQIIPWNFPLLMAAWKIAPALAAGNCVVLKPAEYTSLTALMLAEVFEEVNLPKGVVNIVTGDGSVGESIVTHPDINKIAFTGSTNVGRMIREKTAGSGKKLTLELGGKSPFVVFADADLDSAVEGLVDAIWFNQGQVCCAGSRLLVQEGVADEFIEKVKRRLNNLRIGDPLDKNTDVGAIVDPVQRERIDALVNQSVEQGADLWQPDSQLPQDGCFYPPTLLCNVESSNVAANVEIFGPVLSVMTFRHQPEAIDLANNTRYGLAASVWSENINKALDVAPQLKAGVVWVNSTNQFDAACGFGGYKESGLGREGGKEGMYEYLKPKANSVTKNQPSNATQDPKTKLQPVAGIPGIDQTAKHYINGKQARADNGNTIKVLSSDGQTLGRVGEGNRKDIRNAVEAAHKAASWAKTDTHLRAQLLYYIAENLSYRRAEFCQRLVSFGTQSQSQAEAEFDTAIERLFTYSAWTDKYEGRVHQPPLKGVTLAMNEPLGILGIACPDESPLLAFVTMLAPAIAMGNRVVVVPSQKMPLLATDFYQIIETSDIPAGVINIVTGERDGLVKVLADHDQVDGVWYQGSAEGSQQVELASAANLKRTWVNYGKAHDWYANDVSQQLLREACEVKNIWIPYGD
ncbi:aldehyde dehydrogenase family protein [Aliikangiella marina]|uniref:Aldehyde dehydrogenase family protein n=1 Tax=Aliikangiella marina TaxID=1712262 RepID=A0A545THM6_9GAMM|nr:aldehyde dehydrogenase family protein [Aliikangiella marina]TQV76733.1 aldehyde dehydrogenase family protein [Aliikangiella marina]